MSFERARLPIMTDIIMYHREPRTRLYNPYAPQPEAAFTGLRPHLKENQHYQTVLDKDLVKRAQSSVGFDRSTIYYTNEKGYSHTGSGIGTSYRPVPRDARFDFHRPYGNDKPQVIRYHMSNSNLLFN